MAEPNNTTNDTKDELNDVPIDDANDNNKQADKLDETQNNTKTDETDNNESQDTNNEQPANDDNNKEEKKKEESKEKDDPTKTNQVPPLIYQISDEEFKKLDDLLLNEKIGSNSNDLKWDDIKFENDEEKNGSQGLQEHLIKHHNATNLPPFEMARFFIGSKYRLEKATRKWMDCMAVYTDYKLQNITQQKMLKCFKQMSRCMRFGGTTKDGQLVFAMKYSEWIPGNFDGLEVIMKCFVLILNLLTENLNVSRNGIIFIADCKDMGWKNFDKNMEKIFAKLMQETYPLRVGGFYMMDAPFLINMLIKICKPFLSKKMQERMHIVDKKEMFKIVSSEIVPSICGGTFDDSNEYPFYQSCIRYMRRCGDLEHFAPNDDVDNKGPQQTLCMIKPEAFAKRKEIQAILKKKHFEIKKSMEFTFGIEHAQQFYVDHQNEDFYKDLTEYIASGPCYVMLLERVNGIAILRDLMGPKDVKEAKSDAPESIRAIYGTDILKNAIHGSDGKGEAKRECGYFFDE